VAAVSPSGAADCAKAGALPSAGPRTSKELKMMAAGELCRAEAAAPQESLRP
jgi:hypothetical protein